MGPSDGTYKYGTVLRSPVPRDGWTTTGLRDTLAARVDRIAAKRDRSRAYIVEKAVEAYLMEHERKVKA